MFLVTMLHIVASHASPRAYVLRTATGVRNMDGNSTVFENRAAEALRQQEVHELAMASLERQRRKKQAEGQAVMAAFAGFAAASQGRRWPARIIRGALPAFVILAGASANYLFWAIAMN
jgi:hypothetical protein